MAATLLSKAQQRYKRAHAAAVQAFLEQRALIDALYAAKTSKGRKREIRAQNTILAARKADVEAAAARVDAVTMECVIEDDWLAMLEARAPLIQKLKPEFRAAFERVRGIRTPALLRLLNKIGDEDAECREFFADRDRRSREVLKSGGEEHEDHFGYTPKHPLSLADFEIDADSEIVHAQAISLALARYFNVPLVK